MSARPEISVVIASYNRSRALACAIESVRRQSFDGWELIVVSDGSTDDTPAAVERFGDPRILEGRHSHATPTPTSSRRSSSHKR